jgi:hypothetical protein
VKTGMIWTVAVGVPLILAVIAVSPRIPGQRSVSPHTPPSPVTNENQQRLRDSTEAHVDDPTPPGVSLRDDTEARQTEVPTAVPMEHVFRSMQKSPPPAMLEAEQRFSSEGVDPSWAAAAEAHVLGRIAQTESLALISLRVECRATMCRLELTEPGGSRGALLDGTLKLFGMPPYFSLMLRQQGNLTWVTYMTRW